MKNSNTLQHFMFEHASIRGEIIHLHEVYQTIILQQPYPPLVKKMLGEALISCVLLSGSIKFEGEISLQFNGDERLPLIIVQCDNQLNVRACAKYKQGDNIDYQQAFMNGQMSLSINQYKQTTTYQSIIPIITSSMEENLMSYFAQSEQIPSKVWLAINEESAAGMILQLMPDQNTLQREQFWEYAVQIGQTITQQELLTLDNETILHRLYHETVIRLYDARNVRFKCRCNQTKMKQVLNILGETEIQQLLKEKGHVEICCDFCNQRYVYDPIDIALVFRQ
jgi:molecular chaperone Hsp33